ncbi:hypothetical protein KDJ21_008180 [Metabacillus litoralis]|uniref:hypothetical protein n=1 Tax=Metabacillus TaxID=2675233 RepID=UPI001BA0CAC1|nr:hypothetical protein [Metabacillus litoralis]UHA61616.1 hypothetical protein KDJ21_008180 [Metabacillus litoralis]
MNKSKFVKKIQGFGVIACATAILISPAFGKAQAVNPSHVNGSVTVGILFDDTATQQMKDDIVAQGGVITNSDKGEMFRVGSASFEIQLVSKNGKYSYKTFIDENGNYNFSNVKTGKYEASLVIGEEVLSTQELTINKSKVNDLLVPLNLDDYLNATMHQGEEEEHDHVHDHEGTEEGSSEESVETVVLEETPADSVTSDSEEETVAYSHKYPYKPCIDYNGWNAPDSRHVHDWSHFFGSDCMLAAWIGCTGDHNNNTEYCDGTINCSSIIGHKTSYHAH